jgi:2',3'-cyclic-nucleotide 2'-phosphodiesterase (5'-nucleotidase family)
MRQNFSYTLLITWFLFTISCKTNFIPTGYHAQNISVSNNATQLDSQIVQTYLPFKTLLEKDMNRVISISQQEMTKKRPESLLTNFLTDLLLDESNIIAQNDQLNIKPTISYFNYGGIRTFIPQGEVTVGKIFELMPFENELVFLQLTGKQIQEFMDQIAKNGGNSLGGVRFVIADEKATDIQINGNKLNPDEKYWLATLDFVAEGGDGFTMLQQRSKMIKSGKKIRDIIINHLEEKQKTGDVLTAKLDGRTTNA